MGGCGEPSTHGDSRATVNSKLSSIGGSLLVGGGVT